MKGKGETFEKGKGDDTHASDDDVLCSLPGGKNVRGAEKGSYGAWVKGSYGADGYSWQYAAGKGPGQEDPEPP